MPILTSRSFTTCSSLRQLASSRIASSATSLHSNQITPLSLMKRTSSKGSRRLNPNVISGRLAQMAVSYTACLAIGTNSCWMTLLMMVLQRYSSSIRASPPSCPSQCPKVTVSTTSPLTSRQTTFATSNYITDCATRYCSSSRGQTCLRTRKPRTNPCIFLNLPNPNFFIICLGSKGAFSGGGEVEGRYSLILRMRVGVTGGLIQELEVLAVRERSPAMANRERLFLLSLSIYYIMSGYGWLTESSLLPKKSKPITNDDQSSLFGLRAVLQRERERVSAGQQQRQQKMQRKPQGVSRNAGVEQRAKRDQRQAAAKVHEGARMLQVKGRIYDSLESKGQNVGKLLVDFSAKALLEEDEQYQRMRSEFYSGKLQEIQQQREEIGESEGVGERDVRERLAWQREVLGRLRGQQEEREKVKQVFDRRLLDEEKEALEEVRKEMSEEGKWLEQVKQRREQLQQQRIRKLMKLNIIPQRPKTPPYDKEVPSEEKKDCPQALPIQKLQQKQQQSPVDKQQ